MSTDATTGPNSGPLAAVRVLITRPAPQAENLARLITTQGGEPVRFPTIEIRPPTDLDAFARMVERLHAFSMAIFVSANAVTATMARLRSHALTLPAHLAIACVGAATAHTLAQCGAHASIVPGGRFDSEALLALPALTAVAGQRIVIFRGEGGRELLGQTLVARGAHVEYAECYRRVRPDADMRSLLGQWVDVVTATSVEGLRNLVAMAGTAGEAVLLRTPIVVVSRRLGVVCSELGFRQPPSVAANASDEAIVEEIKAWRGSQKPV
jgi:uroporphyrinogen-III synthase